MEQYERDDDDHHDGPETDKVGRQDGSVSVSEDNKVVSLDIKEGQDEVSPSILDQDLGPTLEAIFVDGVGGVDNVEQDVVEKGLECRDRGALPSKEGCKGIGTSLAEGKSLTGQC